MKFLNWMGITREELMNIPNEIGNDKNGVLIVVGMVVFAILIIRSLPQ